MVDRQALLPTQLLTQFYDWMRAGNHCFMCNKPFTPDQYQTAVPTRHNPMGGVHKQCWEKLND